MDSSPLADETAFVTLCSRCTKLNIGYPKNKMQLEVKSPNLCDVKRIQEGEVALAEI